jgi:hypothetical protein
LPREGFVQNFLSSKYFQQPFKQPSSQLLLEAPVNASFVEPTPSNIYEGFIRIGAAFGFGLLAIFCISRFSRKPASHSGGGSGASGGGSGGARASRGGSGGARASRGGSGGSRASGGGSGGARASGEAPTVQGSFHQPSGLLQDLRREHRKKNP